VINIFSRLCLIQYFGIILDTRLRINIRKMTRIISKLKIGIIILPALFIISGCVNSIYTGNGLLEGTISIGPICPVEYDPPRPECLPTAETYKAYPVGIWTPDGKREITQISPAPDGSYIVILNPGQYLVKLDKDNIAGGSNLPVIIELGTADKFTLNIDIDTGIR
jgi:hypothetical protein